MTYETLTQIQDATVAYNMAARRPNDHRVRSKTSQMVRQWCLAHGYSADQTQQCVRDTWEQIGLERLAAGYQQRRGRWVRSR